MNCTVIVGASGEGKTYFAKQKFIVNAPSVWVMDVNNEYWIDKRSDPQGKDPIKSPKLSDKPTDKRSRYIGGEIMEFLKIAEKKVNTNLIFDEATLFFDGRMTSEITKKLIVSRKHKNNNCVFLFHSIQDVPPFFYRQSNFIVLFKTQDTEDTFTNKSKWLLPYFLKQKRAPKYSKIIIPRG